MSPERNISILNELNFEMENAPKDIAQYIFWTGDELGMW